MRPAFQLFEKNSEFFVCFKDMSNFTRGSGKAEMTILHCLLGVYIVTMVSSENTYHAF